ncbi:cytochrome p450 [Trichoderma arundinaceum]|uniref:Cytochrome p450 n=1 Tax=Trichoderma arundinaceum TaxID=490622 RepID=A0A395NNI8_TRIAR|nr:cytochrome p450 [Trichoderma arundinaceum]
MDDLSKINSTRIYIIGTVVAVVLIYRSALERPVVRLTPNEVSVTNIEAVKRIYNVRETFRKTPWYGDLSVSGENLFNTGRTEVHRRMRRLLSSSMSETSLQTAIPQIQSRIDFSIKRIGEEMQRRGASDVIKWFLFLTTDVIGELSFGDSFRTLEIGEKSSYTKDLENLAYIGAVRSAFPKFVALADYLPIPYFRRPRQSAKNMASYADESITRYRNLLDSDPTSVKWTLFTKVFQDNGKENLTPKELRANASTYIVAGTDTTAVTLTYLVWSVCRDPKVKARLLEELRALPDDFDSSHLRDQSYLNQVIDETLRLYSGIQSALPRFVPEGGDDIGGYWLPGGTVVCTQAYSMHRNSHVFPEPDEFDPSRWASPTKDMKDSFMPFGSGARICIGLHLARMELRYAAARFFLTYPEAKVSTLEGFSDKDMMPKVFFFVEPTAKRCLIQRS